MHGFWASIHRITLLRVTFLTTLAASLALPEAARADFYLHSWENQHEAKGSLKAAIEAGLYSSHDNFDGRGSLLIPTSFKQYSRIQSDLIASYGITSRLSLFARLGWARAEILQTTKTIDAFGLTDSSIAANMRLIEPPTGVEGFTMDIQLQTDFPLYGSASTDESDTTPTPQATPTSIPLGDGTLDVTGGAFGTLPITHLGSSTLSVTGGLGFTYRTSSYSMAVPWSLVAALKPRGDGFSAAFKVTGLFSVGTDPRAEDVVPGTTTFSAASGGSFITGAVNPSLVTIRAEAGYQFNELLALHGFFGQSIWGLAAPNAMYVGAGLTARFGSGHKPKGNGAELSARDYGHSNQGFVNYSLEAKVTRVNDRLNLVKIDKGSQDGIEAGQIFDIFMVRRDGNIGDAVARAHVAKTKMNESALKIDEYFKEIWIDEGFVAKRPVQ